MSKTAYHISLKGYDFDRSDVDAVLAENEGKRVNVLINSLGCSLATGLSISAAFRNHGDVAVHFVGLNASAATIASLDAAHISIDESHQFKSLTFNTRHDRVAGLGNCSQLNGQRICNSYSTNTLKTLPIIFCQL